MLGPYPHWSLVPYSSPRDSGTDRFGELYVGTVDQLIGQKRRNVLAVSALEAPGVPGRRGNEFLVTEPTSLLVRVSSVPFDSCHNVTAPFYSFNYNETPGCNISTEPHDAPTPARVGHWTDIKHVTSSY